MKTDEGGHFAAEFPGVFWNKEKRTYLTNKRNLIFDVLDRLSGTCENEKGPPLDEAVPLYGQWDNYRTNFDDFWKVYLFGIQVDMGSLEKLADICYLCQYGQDNQQARSERSLPEPQGSEPMLHQECGEESADHHRGLHVL